MKLLIMMMAAAATLFAQSTKPWRLLNDEPGFCGLGEVYQNVTTGKVRFCSVANTWSDLGGSSTGAFLDASNVIGYYRLFEQSNCNVNGSSVVDSSTAHNNATVTNPSGTLTCDATGWYNFGATANVTLPSGMTANTVAVEVLFDPAGRASKGPQQALDLPQPVIGSSSTTPQFFTGSYNAGLADQIFNYALSIQSNLTTQLSMSYSTIPPGPNHLAWVMYNATPGYQTDSTSVDWFYINGIRDRRIAKISGNSSGVSRTGTLIIGSNGTYSTNGKILSILIRKTAPTDATVQADREVMLSDAKTLGGGPLTRPLQWPDYPSYHTLAATGDSICNGSGVRSWLWMPSGMVNSNGTTAGVMAAPGPYGFLPVSACVSGGPLNSLSDPLAFMRFALPWKSVYGTSFFLIQGGTNVESTDPVAGGTGLWDNYTDLMVRTARNNGFVPVVATLVDRGDINVAPGRDLYNQRVRERCGEFDSNKPLAANCLVIDFASNSNVGWAGAAGLGGTTWMQSDRVHPTLTGNQVMAPIYANVISGFWGTSSTNPSTTIISTTVAQGSQDLYVPMNPGGAQTATSTLPSAVGITNQIRRVVCLATATGTCTINTTSSQTITGLTGAAVTSVNIVAGQTLVVKASYGSLQYPLNGASGWIRLPDSY